MARIWGQRSVTIQTEPLPRVGVGKGHTWNFGKQNEMHNFIETPICMGHERVKDAREAAIKPDQQRAIGPSHVQPTWRTPVKYVQLMPQQQDLGFQPPSRFEAVAQSADEKEGSCDHPAIMF
jgi:hypothetical protein